MRGGGKKQVSIAERVWKLANPMWEAVSIYPEDSEIILEPCVAKYGYSKFSLEILEYCET